MAENRVAHALGLTLAQVCAAADAEADLQELRPLYDEHGWIVRATPPASFAANQPPTATPPADVPRHAATVGSANRREGCDQQR